MADENAGPTYDIVIIGAGTAGCVLANRLSEDPSISVLLLEAGQDCNKDERVSIPGLALQLLDNPEFDWQYISEPQPGLHGRQMKHPRGRIVGGSSAINSFALIYGSAAGFDAWADLGNKGWDWNGIKKYFRKFQTISQPNDKVRDELRINPSSEETSGPLQASFPLTVLLPSRIWLDTFRSLGLENVNDPLDGAALGGYTSTCHVTNDRARSHAGIAFYEPVRHRSNLALITGAVVQKIHFDHSEGGEAIATGVTYIKQGKPHHVSIRQDVLLAAGTFATPQILELSGIGDSALLHQHGIAEVYNNPNVGENLQDHIRFAIPFEATDTFDTSPPVSAFEARKLYDETRSGPLAERTAFSFAYMPLDPFLSANEKQQLSQILDQYIDNPSLSEFEQMRNAFIEKMILSPSEATAVAFLSRKFASKDSKVKNPVQLNAMLSHPFSKGSVHITSEDVTRKPQIDFGYYTHPLDLEVHARHLQALIRLSKTAPLSEYIKPDTEYLPANLDGFSLEQAQEFITKYSSTNYHPCGTCSMLPEHIGGVVDNKLRVYGTTNVRVVDASIMPIIPRGNIITTVHAVAEKASDIISHDLNIKRVT